MDNRRSQKEIFLEIAETVSKRSTCCKMKVGCILVKNDRIISTGYNGVCAKQEHCYDYWLRHFEKYYSSCYNTFDKFLKSEAFRDGHHDWSLKNELHAEMNVLMFALKHGVSSDGCDIYATHSPCFACSKLIIAAGIKHVYYKTLYKKGEEALTFLKENGVKVTELNESK
jgi:dCMP deaminase